MNLSQTLLVLIMINILNLFVGFSLEYGNIEDLNDKVLVEFREKFSKFSSFSAKSTDEGNWFTKVVSSVWGGAVDAFNLVFIGLQLIGIILSSQLRPASELFFAENVTILGLMGLVAVLYLWWFNIMTIMKVYKFLKGSDQ